MIETIAIVESNLELAPGYRLLTLNFDQELHARAGQFAMLKAHTAFEPLLRRALAIYRIHGPQQMSFLYQVLGRGTETLAQVNPGGKVEALIPLGNSWPKNETEITTESAGLDAPQRAIVVAGGIGSASLLMLCEEMIESRTDTQIFFGAANERAAAGCGLEDFRALNLPLTVTTDDGSLGERGFVTAPLERFLREGGGTNATVYTCGPWVMMRRTAEIAAQFGVPCIVSLEAPMGCGFGVCVGCVVAVKTGEPLGYGSYKRVCIDGSIFPAEMIRWEVNAMAH
ncbi:MAG TPA: dihydroorotate dehydrogenase electron transfer subunit [Blastocatellia bacterium]|nr:dihydroorotate dehydrogenase electron transfer subunit [Blastocatellia bacterium]